MKALLWSCVVYMAGVAAILYFKPNLMFYPDGEWREFGFDREQKTAFPFWLFCIVWAIISYGVVSFLCGSERPEPILPIQSNVTIRDFVPTETSYLVSEPNRVPTVKRGRKALPPDLRPGYYMLNTESPPDINGVPRYIFVGAEPPDTSMVGSEDM